MALVLTEEQQQLRDSARGFLAESAPVSQLRALRDERDETGYRPQLWKAFANMGYSGVLVPEDHGGIGLGYVEAGIVMEEIGRKLAVSPMLGSAIVAVTLLRQAGSAAQQRTWLPGLAAGERVAALAVDELSKHRPEAIALRAAEAGGGFELEGAKTFVVDGHVADLLIVAARTAGDAGDEKGISLFLLKRGTPGVEVERLWMVDSHNAARIRFDRVQVPASALLGPIGGGWSALQKALDAGRVAAAAELLGVAEAVFARTLGYLKERRQFGHLIGEFQALQHRAAELYCDIELSRSAVLGALQSLDADAPNASQAVAVAKAHAGLSATRAVQEGVQMHGGMGMTDELDIGFFMKRARVLEELYGDANYHLDRLAQATGY